ncbi:hypothetical protein CONLIGDRAFT_680048 [Coniochaeta ligniaria NRRL 30616]|uniref:Uncharacterized protein n=1 Tax=Coniochaeta ligniaria NRRL 30616 TaxID=1408157 RepID=A0A1J7JDB9_9PEZI|nr:hypothetical protein CONLIGDRAFT_680048 [Coniochaeta ligniaria NRRL 30616]
MDWPTAVTSPFELTTFNRTYIPSDYLPIMRAFTPPDHNTAQLSPSQTCPSPDIHFETLSKINVDLYGLCNAIFRHAPTRTLDTPIGYLVISCFVQLICPLEVCVSIMHARKADTSSSEPRLVLDVAFANVLGQIQLMLGLPSPWSTKSAWTGLLTPPRYRDMLNAELGVVEGGWTARSEKLMEVMEVMSTTKELLLEGSMMGGRE